MEANREWFVRLKQYLIERYHAAKDMKEGRSSHRASVTQVDVPVAPIIAARSISPYKVEITVLNEEVVDEECKEHLFVVKYRTLPHVAVPSPAQS